MDEISLKLERKRREKQYFSFIQLCLSFQINIEICDLDFLKVIIETWFSNFYISSTLNNCLSFLQNNTNYEKRFLEILKLSIYIILDGSKKGRRESSDFEFVIVHKNWTFL